MSDKGLQSQVTRLVFFAFENFPREKFKPSCLFFFGKGLFPWVLDILIFTNVLIWTVDTVSCCTHPSPGVICWSSVHKVKQNSGAFSIITPTPISEFDSFAHSKSTYCSPRQGRPGLENPGSTSPQLPRKLHLTTPSTQPLRRFGSRAAEF